MIIEKVEDGKKSPRCPDCGVVLYLESTELSNAQKAQQKIYDECDHEWVPFKPMYRLHPSDICKKCGYRVEVGFVDGARLMRCPKCAALYHVEGD